MEASCDEDSSGEMHFLVDQSIASQTNRKIEVNSFSDLNKSAALEFSGKNKSIGDTATGTTGFMSRVGTLNGLDQRKRSQNLSKTHYELSKANMHCK